MSGLVPADYDALEKTALISPEGMTRFKSEPTIPPRTDDTDESMESFAIRRFGTEVYEKIIEPLLGGIYGGRGSELSILATFPQLRHKEKSEGSIQGSAHAPQGQESAPAHRAPGKYPPFVSLKNGMESLTASLERALTRTKVVLSTPVVSVIKEGATYRVTGGDDTEFEFDCLILTTPAHVSGVVLESLDPALAELHRAIPHTSSTIVSLVYDEADLEHPLDGYGYITLPREERTVHAMTWSSRKWPNRAPEGTVLVRAFLGGSGDAMLQQTDEEILAVVESECNDLMHIAIPPRSYRIDRYENSMPQYVVGHNDHVATIEARACAHEHLHLTGMAYYGVGIPDCIKSANAVAAKIASQFG
jgi:oxygen-dependent protoporphyrinogen oxidase